MKCKEKQAFRKISSTFFWANWSIYSSSYGKVWPTGSEFAKRTLLSTVYKVRFVQYALISQFINSVRMERYAVLPLYNVL